MKQATKKSGIHLDGRKESERILQRLKRTVRAYRRPITLATVVVGERYDSLLYVRLKRLAAARVGIRTEYIHLPASTSDAALQSVIVQLNRRRGIHGILLQLPLPPHLNADAAIAAMDPRKDVDGFHPKNTFVVSPPIAAVERLLRMAKAQASGRVLLIGKTSVFTSQLSARLTKLGYRCTIRRPRQTNISSRTFDCIVTAVGTGAQLTAADIAPGAILIDVGIRKQGKKTVGDVGPSCWKKAAAISPVPGGVGPLTIAYVLVNTARLATQKKVA